MKNIKRILLAFVAVFAAVLLVACGAKSDNGTYVYKPSKTELKKILEEQGLSGSQLESIGDVINFNSNQGDLMILKNAKLKRTK